MSKSGAPGAIMLESAGVIGRGEQDVMCWVLQEPAVKGSFKPEGQAGYSGVSMQSLPAQGPWGDVAYSRSAGVLVQPGGLHPYISCRSHRWCSVPPRAPADRPGHWEATCTRPLPHAACSRHCETVEGQVKRAPGSARPGHAGNFHTGED